MLERVGFPARAIVGIAFMDYDIGGAHLSDWVLLIEEFVEGSEDGDPAPTLPDILGHLEQIVDKGWVSRVNWSQQGLKFLEGDDALQVDIDNFDDLIAVRMLFQPCHKEGVFDFFELAEGRG